VARLIEIATEKHSGDLFLYKRLSARCLESLKKEFLLNREKLGKRGELQLCNFSLIQQEAAHKAKRNTEQTLHNCNWACIVF